MHVPESIFEFNNRGRNRVFGGELNAALVDSGMEVGALAAPEFEQPFVGSLSVILDARTEIYHFLGELVVSLLQFNILLLVGEALF